MLIRRAYRGRLVGIEVPARGEPLFAYGDVLYVVRGMRHCVPSGVLVRGQMETLCPLWALRTESRSDRQTPEAKKSLGEFLAAVPDLINPPAPSTTTPTTCRSAA